MLTPSFTRSPTICETSAPRLDHGRIKVVGENYSRVHEYGPFTVVLADRHAESCLFAFAKYQVFVETACGQGSISMHGHVGADD